MFKTCILYNRRYTSDYYIWFDFYTIFIFSHCNWHMYFKLNVNTQTGVKQATPLEMKRNRVRLVINIAESEVCATKHIY